MKTLEQEEVVARTDDELLALMRERYAFAADDLLARVVDALRERHGEALLGVILYGSRLWKDTSKATSLLDFFVVAEDYRRFHRRRRDAVLNRILAPSTYMLRVGDERCKYNVVSLADLRRETSPGARDLFHAGRLSKRVGLLWVRDPGVTDELLGCCLGAMKTVLPLALGRLEPEFTFDQLLHGVLAISYAAERRVESDTKVDSLFAVEALFYRAVYGAFLARLARSEGDLAYDGAADVWHQDYALTERRRVAAEDILRRSRLRMYARWFKYMATLEGWTEMLLEKVERTKGIKLELTPLQRRYPYIFGWPHFFRLLRKGMVK